MKTVSKKDRAFARKIQRRALGANSHKIPRRDLLRALDIGFAIDREARAKSARS